MEGSKNKSIIRTKKGKCEVQSLCNVSRLIGKSAKLHIFGKKKVMEKERERKISRFEIFSHARYLSLLISPSYKIRSRKSSSFSFCLQIPQGSLSLPPSLLEQERENWGFFLFLFSQPPISCLRSRHGGMSRGCPCFLSCSTIINHFFRQARTKGNSLVYSRALCGCPLLSPFLLCHNDNHNDLSAYTLPFSLSPLPAK